MYSGTPFERPPPLERPLDNVNLNINVLISTSDERPLLKGQFLVQKGWPQKRGSTIIIIPVLQREPCKGVMRQACHVSNAWHEKMSPLLIDWIINLCMLLTYTISGQYTLCLYIMIGEHNYSSTNNLKFKKLVTQQIIYQEKISKD